MSETEARLDLDAVEEMLRNPETFSKTTIAEGLHHAVAELRNARTTIAEDLIYIRRLEEDMTDYGDDSDYE